MSTSIQAALHEHFGFEQFKPGQAEVIERLMAGRSAAAVFPTGGGKSVCYQLPSVLLPGLTLVVSPLIALMKDQIDALAARGISAERLDSTLDADGSRRVMDQIRSGKLRLLYVAPERFNNERFRAAIERTPVSLFAVDEAHCISEWGHNFRPDYLKLSGFARQCRAERVLALTATATPQVLADICQVFDIAPECAVRTGFYRENLTMLATPIAAKDRDAQLIARLRQRPAGPTILYVTLQRTAETLAASLTRAGFQAKAYHAGLEDEVRSAVQDWFFTSDHGMVVATIAFGMGVDKANIRYVYHYNPPKSLENYSQEIGRAGRDGRPATCEMFLCPDDLNVLENFVYGDTPTQESIRGLLSEIFSQEEAFDTSQFDLSAAHDIRMLVVRTLLTYLELLGYLEGGTPFYSSYQFKPLFSSAEILRRFEGERRAFLADVFRQSTKAKIWFHIDVDQAAAALGAPRERIVKALDYLGEQQLLELKTAGVRLRFRRLKQPANLEDLTRKLYERTQQREARELARLQQVVELVRMNGCQVAALCAHFAETLDQPCGHCTWCLAGGKAAILSERQPPTIDETVWAKAAAFRKSQRAVLCSPRDLARLLCGVTSPKLSRAKLGSHPLFGVLSHVPFQTVLDRAER